MSERLHHWEQVWRTKQPGEVSWYVEHPATSYDLIARYAPAGSVIDVGGGESRLGSILAAAGHDVAVLDIAPNLSTPVERVTRITADITCWRADRTYAVWHDRAAFHFLTHQADRDAYVACGAAAVSCGGVAIIATFAFDGPETCSGLPVVRYDTATLAACFAPSFDLIDSTDEIHVTPWQSTQHFIYAVLRRR